MTIINYFNQFWREDDIKPFSPSETRLYFFLLHAWNKSGREDWFECKTKALEDSLGMNKMTLTRCREKLQRRNLIKYIRGDRKSKNPYYFLCDVTNNVTNDVTNDVTNSKRKNSPTPPIKENNYSELREKENNSDELLKKDKLSSRDKKKEIDLKFALPSYIPILEEWLSYKRERRQAYTPKGIRACYNNLLALSGNNPEIAKLIVEQSIANNWAGLFELKTNEQRTQGTLRTAPRPSFNNYNEAEARQVGKPNIIEL